MSRDAVIRIRLSALRQNLARVRALVGPRKIMAMIKANAYGHGLIPVAKALSDVDAFGVAALDEARELREQGIQTPIVIMSGFYEANELPELVALNLQPVIHHHFQIELLEKAHLKKPLKAWFKIDSGMHRLGFLPDEVPKAYQRLQACVAVENDMVLMTHFADADNLKSSFTEQQAEVFHHCTAGLPGLKSVGHSAAIMAYPHVLQDWVRPGIMLYGVSPLPNTTGLTEQLAPVMTLTAKIMSIKDLQVGDKVGYGCTFECVDAMRIATVAIGYGDGYPRHAPTGTPVLVGGVECPLIGRVSMDMLAIDLRQQPRAIVGDTVTLWGPDLPIERIAEQCGTIPYELCCKITLRVSRQFI